MKVKVQALDGGKAGSDIELNDAVFGVEPRADILHRVVTWQLEKRRGTARGARERSDVARTGKKFGRQKGGGTARHGDRRAPIFIGGGKAHGPRVRDFNPSLNKKVRALGLKMALSAKAKGGNLIVVDNQGGLLATATITLPACTAQMEGPTAEFASRQGVTALTVNAASGSVSGNEIVSRRSAAVGVTACGRNAVARIAPSASATTAVAASATYDRPLTGSGAVAGAMVTAAPDDVDAVPAVLSANARSCVD